MHQPQVIYIVSSEWSGSTWLSFVLGSHRRAATLGEHWRRFKGNRDSECRTCQHRGLAHCEILHGIASAPLRDAYALPLERYAPLGVDTLIDNSKFVDWLEELRAAGACDPAAVRVIHLVRDPRGWIASAMGRNPARDAAQLLGEWKRAVIDQQARLSGLGLPSLPLSYDMACLDPGRILEDVSAFVGIRYGLDQLRYWEHVHHAMAGNGAAISVVPGGKGATWDRDYYLARLDRVFHDDRWRRRLDPVQIGLVTGDPEAARLMEEFGGGFDRIDALAAARDASDGEVS